MITKVVLHGLLAKACGKAVWMLDVNTPGEALRAIEANTKRLYSFLGNEAKDMPFHVIVDGKPTKALEDLVAPVRHFKTIHFVPLLTGAGNSGSMFAIIGVALILVAVAIISFGAAVPAETAAAASAEGLTAGYAFGLASATAAFWASTTMALGISLVLGGLASLIAPGAGGNSHQGKPSFLFNGAENTMRQGVPVPIAYGEVIVGSATISSGLTAVEIPLKFVA